VRRRSQDKRVEREGASPESSQALGICGRRIETLPKKGQRRYEGAEQLRKEAGEEHRLVRAKQAEGDWVRSRVKIKNAEGGPLKFGTEQKEW